MPKLEAGQTVLSGLAGFSQGLIEGMKYRKELQLKEAELAERKEYRQEQSALSRERFEESKSQFEQEMDLKEKTYEKKFGPGGTERVGSVQKELMSLFGRERQITDSNLRAELNLNKLSTDMSKALDITRQGLDEKEHGKFDAGVIQLRQLVSEGDMEGANIQIANLQKKYNMPASVGLDIATKQKSMDNYKRTIEDNTRRLEQLNQMKSPYLKQIEAKTDGFVQKTDLPDPVKQELKQATLEVRTPEDARRVIPHLMRIDDPDLRNEGAELILQMMKENENIKLPSTPEAQRKTEDINIRSEQEEQWNKFNKESRDFKGPK